MRTLEDRYRRLLRAYPSAYRADRGAEILDTLLDAAPEGRRRPTFRDRRTLVMGGLRVRSAQNRRLSMATNVRLALMFAIAIELGWTVTVGVSESTYADGGTLHHVYGFTWIPFLLGLAVLATVVLGWIHRRILGAGAASVAGILALVAHGTAGLYSVALLGAFVILSFRKEPLPRPWRWLFGVILAIQLMWTMPTDVIRVPGLPWLPFAVAIVALGWAVVDARPALAICLFVVIDMAALIIEQMLQAGGDWSFVTSMSLIVLVPLVLAIPITWRIRRQARL
jgi:hypothetical protein